MRHMNPQEEALIMTFNEIRTQAKEMLNEINAAHNQRKVNDKYPAFQKLMEATGTAEKLSFNIVFPEKYGDNK